MIIPDQVRRREFSLLPVFARVARYLPQGVGFEEVA
jgi:hypothetical protein